MTGPNSLLHLSQWGWGDRRSRREDRRCWSHRARMDPGNPSLVLALCRTLTRIPSLQDSLTHYPERLQGVCARDQWAWLFLLGCCHQWPQAGNWFLTYLEVREQSTDNLGPDARFLAGRLPLCAHVTHPWCLVWMGLQVAASSL